MNNNVNTRKIVLMTREGDNNHYWDTSFSLRPTFRGNSAGQYKITVNEALFNNTEPLINKDDYYQFIITTSANYKFVWTVKVRQDYYLYRQGGAEWTEVIRLLLGTLGTQELSDPANPNSKINFKYKYTETIRERFHLTPEAEDPVTHVKTPAHWDLQETYANNNLSYNMDVLLRNDSGTQFNGTNRGINPLMYYDVCNIQLGNNSYGTVAKIEMTYSQGFVYILNNRALIINEITDNSLKPSFSPSNTDSKYNYTSYTGHHFFEFCNIRIGGPYLYILDMPTVKTDVMTMNEANQSYNITGMVKNTADNHNENVQFISSMEGRVNSLSNFRVRLLNDNFEPVRIRSPLYVQITVSNDEY